MQKIENIKRLPSAIGRQDFLKLRAIIGEDAAILSNDALEQIVDELMQSRVGIHN